MRQRYAYVFVVLSIHGHAHLRDWSTMRLAEIDRKRLTKAGCSCSAVTAIAIPQKRADSTTEGWR